MFIIFCIDQLDLGSWSHAELVNPPTDGLPILVHHIIMT